MADIDPYGQIQQYTPRTPNLVDAVAEAKRVSDAILRANPLTDATIDDGRMTWRGNYATGLSAGDIRSSLLWIGEFSPNDAVLNKPQRGFALTRDDPNHQPAFWLYDPFADTRTPSNPVKQVLRMNDNSGGTVMSEGQKGGLQFPYGVIPLYGTAFNYQNVRTDSGTTLELLPILPPFVVMPSGPRTYWEGYGPMVGHKVRFYGFGQSTSGGGSYQMHMEVDFSDGQAPFVTPNLVMPANSSREFFIEADLAGQNKVGKEAHVRIIAEMLSGGNKWNFLFPAKCYSSSD